MSFSLDPVFSYLINKVYNKAQLRVKDKPAANLMKLLFFNKLLKKYRTV